MEHHLDLEKESSDGKKSGIPNGCSLHQSRQNKKLGHWLQFDKQESYFDDFCPELIKNVDSPVSKYKGFHQKQRVGRKVHQSEELVKYMSKLPSFLERGENLPEKAFNVGVLDWHILEKWQLNRKEIIRGNGKHTPFSTNASPISLKNGGKFQDCKAGPIHPLKEQQSTVGAHQSFSQDTENRLKERRIREPDVPRNSETRRVQHLESDSLASGSKGKMKVRPEAMMGEEELEVTTRNVTDCYYSDRNKTAVLFPKEGQENRFSAISDAPHSSKGGDQRSMDVNRRSLAGESSVSVCHADVPREAKKIVSWLDHPCSKDENIKLSEIKQTVKFPDDISFSPSSGKKLEEKNLSLTSETISKNKSSDQELNPKTEISLAGKVRNPSPTRRFSFDMGKMGRSPSSKETSAIPYSGAKDFIVKSGSEVTSTSTCDKSNDTSRSRSSPLRRLLDPFLKPKAGISDHFGKSSERDSSTTDKAVKSSTVREESPAFHFASVKFDLKDCKTIDIDNPNNEKTGSSTVQALLQVAVKNGIPLYTFAVDKKKDILAATVKDLSLRKNVNRWIYTFFSLQEMKKKNGHWINQGGKDGNHRYISKFVAQMRVSDVFSSEPSTRRSVTKSRSREFVLFSMGTRDVDHQTSDMLPSDELAAIIMKFSGKSDSQINQDVQLSGNSKDDEGNPYLVPSEDLLSTTVLLPGGEHGLPGKGEPSPLIERWKSGGSCDCGGWDMGCKIRVLDNNNQSSEKCSSTGGRFELFSQDEISETKLVFSLSWFSDGIFSVEFSSSLELLQAFSIGIALFNGMKPAIFSEPDNFVGCKTSEEISLPENNAAKISKQEVSAKYASLPPLSPAGRV
ncbi:uncharacterized protein LOC111407807 [Olea europaea var. sylvestris]|uniref:uncharacterized protein LOC111407807 n=1 Tax=Olea europaea var. sylvestris TaxID=158386 RepID=UPI000C1D8092|nr:uncharacterized protein LOC111407807 [Olea europaea var. sylvestris]XP_022893254.1 uncharacterized protein LOC111407807 [Olea europaea var. sylvestris]